MIINYNDGSTFNCSKIVFYDGNVMADDIYIINIEDIESIMEA